MQIIEKIKKTNSFSENYHSEINKICINKLKSNPLPNKKSERWRLTNKSKFTRFLNYSFSDKFFKPSIPKDLENKAILRLIIGEEKKIHIKKTNWIIKELSEVEIINLIKEKVSQNDSNENWSDLLNLCLSDQKNILGLNISGLDVPNLEIFSNSKNNLFHAKTLIINIEKNTNVDLMQINLGDKDSGLSLTSYLFLGAQSKVNHGIVSYGVTKSHLINSLNVFQKEKSEYNLGSIQFKFDFARLEININQVQGNAKTNIKGIQITEGNEQISTYANITFNGPNGFLDQLNKSLAQGKSHAIFEGLIEVPQVAQQTDASQLSRNILLSNYAKIDTKPQLEIIADDVKCKHGATISQLNENELFYMRSRGLTLEEASKLQLKSYYQEIISFLPLSKERWDLLGLLLNNN
tara:strand:- start:635 stop:1858 length:1224 start_codon:yes stop_codon:yes gene_type:complete